MSIGWQEIVALGVVVLAVWIVGRRLRGPASGGGCCGGSPSCTAEAERGVRVRELHDIRVTRPLDENERPDAGPPPAGD